MSLKFPSRHINASWYRLIPSRFPTVELYERLGDERIQNAAKASEAVTNPRLVAAARSHDGGSPRLQNWNHAPFAYKNPEGSYLLGPAFGVLDLVETRRAALAYFLLRREQFLARTSEAPTGLDMRLLITPISGSFADLTGLPTDIRREDRWKIGQTLYEDGISGAITKRPEVPHALFLSVFDGGVLGATVQSAHYRFAWDGKKIKSIYDFETASGQTISREELLAEATHEQLA